MNNFKRISLCLVFVIAMLCCSFLIPFNKKQVQAESNDDIILSVKKVNYTNPDITTVVEENGSSTTVVKRLGEYTPRELKSNLEDILKSSNDISNNEVINIEKTSNEAVLVSLLPNSEKNYIIQTLSVALTVNDISTPSQLLDNENGTILGYLRAFDFTKIIGELGKEIDYKALGYGNFKFTFTYSYTTNGQDTKSETKEFNFNIIDNNSYFTDYSPILENVDQGNYNQKLVYYFNNQFNNNPVLKFYPDKFIPTISMNYNEDNVILTFVKNENTINLISSDEKIYKNKTLEIKNGLVEVSLDTLGEYKIEYNLVINNIVIDKTRTVNIKEFPSHSLYIFGFEAFYKDYSTNNLDYAKLSSQSYKSNISYNYRLDPNATTFENVKNLVSPQTINFPKTNQAPIKLNNYTTEILNAKYYLVENGVLSNEKSFTPSTRFNSMGKYVLIIEYNFSLISENSYFDIIAFEIENTTPKINFYSGFENDNNNPWINMTGNTYTNKNVKVSWALSSQNPFSVEPRIKISKNNTIIDYSNLLKTNQNENYVIFKENGVYSVSIQYGQNYANSVEKNFVIDNTSFDYKVFSVSSEESSFILGGELTKDENLSYFYTTNAFSIFVKNKEIKNNINISYDYVALEENLDTDLFQIDNNQNLHIFRNKILKSFYDNLTYSNILLNNLTNWTSVSLKNNSNAVITNAGLYCFKISDEAQNIKLIYVFLDNSSPNVLQCEDILENNEDINSFLTDNASNLKVKSKSTNFVSTNYSLIFGDYSTIKFEITTENENFAKSIFGNNISVGSNTVIPTKYNTSSIVVTNKDEALNYIEAKSNNILCVTAPVEEIDINYEIKSTINEKEYIYCFNLNTDKNKILIYASSDENNLYRIYKENEIHSGVTNQKTVYIRFNDEYTDGFKLKSLKLDFYPFEFGTEFSIATLPAKSIELLTNAKLNDRLTEDINNSILSGGYITDIINPTYQNGEYVTSEGKYILTKTYVGFDENLTMEENGVYKQVSQTFYVDRHSPIEKIENYLVGKNYSMKLDENNLTCENILYYILNNQNIVTNMNSFTSNIKDILKYNTNISNLKVNFIVKNAKNNIIFDSKNSINPNYNFTEIGTYIIILYDNSGYSFNGQDNINPNTFEFRIELKNDKPEGNYIVDNEKIIRVETSSSKTGNLSFTFQDSESDFLYDIDLCNLELRNRKSGDIIFKTYSENNNNNLNTLTVNNQIIYYYSSIGNISISTKLLNTKKLPNDKDRYSYTITILDEKNPNSLFENGESIEAEYVFTISYKTTKNLDYKSNQYTMIIDHTPPYSNANKLVDNDNFLTSEEKTQMKESIKNKDKTRKINFENYAFIIKDKNDIPKFFDNTDTYSIFVRKYNKYTSTNAIDLQSLVQGDNRFNSPERLNFNISAVNSEGNRLYEQKSYTSKEILDFISSSGYYEIIEIDEAENYTIYSIFYLESLDYNFELIYNDGNTDKKLESNDIEINSNKFVITSISPKSPYLPINIKFEINTDKENISKNLRYFPLNIQSDDIEYFNSIDNLIDYINNQIKLMNNTNAFCKLTISNQTGIEKTITINSPGEKLNLSITDFENSFTITIPNKNLGTSIKALNIYPVVNGEKQATTLYFDSNKNEIDVNSASSYSFNSTIYLGDDINNLTQISNVTIFYIEWIDNFDRVQNVVKILGIEDVRRLELEKIIYKEIDNEIYTADTDLNLIYQSNLYNLKVEYAEYTSNSYSTLFDTSISDDNNEFYSWNSTGKLTINLFEQLVKIKSKEDTSKDIEFESNAYKFLITLTDLSSLKNNENIQTYTLSYVYYPQLPTLSFTDSASNVLNIKPYKEGEQNFELSTSRSVTLSYINNTLFNVKIVAIRVYEENKRQITEKIDNVSNGHIFNNLGSYEIVIENELGKQVKYNKFNIKPTSNKTYSIYTNEIGMENFELSDFVVKEINGKNYEVYYTIFNTKIEVNSDFGLILESVESDNENENLYVIKQYSATKEDYVEYKYIAVIKIVANNNFLEYDDEDEPKLIIKNHNDVVINSTITTSTLKTSETITLEAPLYNGDLNKISIKVYYNNKQIEFNSNFVNVTEDKQIINFKNLPSGIYSIYFEDLAGNTQTFAGNLFLNILYMKEVLVQLNGNSPINYQIFNDDVSLTIEQENQYDSRSIKIEAKRNGKEITDIGKKTQYTFTEYGFYEITVSANVLNNVITKKISFTILNPNEALIEFGVIPLNSQTITKIIKDGVDVTNDFKKFITSGNNDSSSKDYKDIILDRLNLSNTLYFYEYEYELDDENNIKLDENGNKIIKKDKDGNYIFKTHKLSASGHYEIEIENKNSIIGNQSFSFKVWIRNENINLRLKSTLKEGETTTKAIKFSYNPYLIYSQIGECKIYLNDDVILEINEQSSNEVLTFEIPKKSKGTFIVQIKDNNGNTELSYVVNKKEPLSTVSIIVIVLSTLLVSAGVIIFIKLRTKMKVK